MEIRRDFYLDKLIKRKNNGLIKVITGIRRCGKSYLLNNLFYHHLLESGIDADHIIRFAFDSADDLYLIGESLIQIEKEKRGVDPEKFMAYIRSKVVGEGMYYLLLDEIQMLDCFEAVLNGYLRKDNMDVFVTGIDVLPRASPWESGHGNDGCVPKDVLHRLWPARPVRPRLIV